jgi:cytochrome c oxidase assembly protein subunit 15
MSTLFSASPLTAPRSVRVWLLTGLVMVFFQIVIGGITRLTGSGLSITRWEIVTGTLPPLSAAAWDTAFELYKATPQYQKINQGMSLGDFKFIYFWEYFHRLWARLMFVVFVIPFAWFLRRGLLTRALRNRLLVVVALAGLEGFFGWIMVASGLIRRPWVNAYNLTLHLSMAIVIFGYLLWTYFVALRPATPGASRSAWAGRFAWGLVLLAFVQIALGAMMSGTKAGLAYPNWPDMGGEYLPALLLDGQAWAGNHFVDYDSHPFLPTLLQFLHRNTAYVLSGLLLYFVWKSGKLPEATALLRRSSAWLLGLLGLQVLLGILTLLHCVGSIPVLLGVLHQAGAIFLFTALLWVCYLWRNP